MIQTQGALNGTGWGHRPMNGRRVTGRALNHSLLRKDHAVLASSRRPNCPGVNGSCSAAPEALPATAASAEALH